MCWIGRAKKSQNGTTMAIGLLPTKGVSRGGVATGGHGTITTVTVDRGSRPGLILKVGTRWPRVTEGIQGYLLRGPVLIIT